MLTVLQVAYPFAPVGPDAIGGAEQIVHQLDIALAAAGHRSILIACEGSTAAGELIVPAPLPAIVDDDARRTAWADYHAAIAAVLRSRRVDVVHFHGIDFLEYLPACDVPIMATLHLPPEWYAPSVFARGIRLVCVSVSQRRACPATHSEISVVRNGVAVDRFTDGRRCRFALCLARICPEKGPHLAVEAARRAGVALALAGHVFPYPAHEAYFVNEIAPLLDRRRRFLGPVGGRRKTRLLANAGCLLVPSEVHETSSLVAMEALASGTPVVAFRRGALPEIVEHGRTGLLVEDVAEMATAIGSARELSSAACRAAAREHFAAERMAAEYLRIYEEMQPPR